MKAMLSEEISCLLCVLTSSVLLCRTIRRRLGRANVGPIQIQRGTKTALFVRNIVMSSRKYMYILYGLLISATRFDTGDSCPASFRLNGWTARSHI
jgi:hypothetical protein